MEWDGAYYWPENRSIQVEEAIDKRENDCLEAGDCWCHRDCYYSQPRTGTKLFPRNRKSRPHFWRGPGSFSNTGNCEFHALQIQRGESIRYSQFYHDLRGWLRTEGAENELEFLKFSEVNSNKYSDFTLFHGENTALWSKTEIVIIHKNRKRTPKTEFFVHIDLSQWTKEQLANFEGYGLRKVKEEFAQLKLKKERERKEEKNRIEEIANVERLGEEIRFAEEKLIKKQKENAAREADERKTKLELNANNKWEELESFSVSFREFFDKFYEGYNRREFGDVNPEAMRDKIKPIFVPIRRYRVINYDVEVFNCAISLEEHKVQLKNRMTDSDASLLIKAEIKLVNYQENLSRMEDLNIETCDHRVELQNYASAFIDGYSPGIPPISVVFADELDPSYRTSRLDAIKKTVDILDLLIARERTTWENENENYLEDYHTNHRPILMKTLQHAEKEEQRYAEFAPRSRWKADRSRWNEWKAKVVEASNRTQESPYDYMRKNRDYAFFNLLLKLR